MKRTGNTFDTESAGQGLRSLSAPPSRPKQQALQLRSSSAPRIRPENGHFRNGRFGRTSSLTESSAASSENESHSHFALGESTLQSLHKRHQTHIQEKPTRNGPVTLLRQRCSQEGRRFLSRISIGTPPLDPVVLSKTECGTVDKSDPRQRENLVSNENEKPEQGFYEVSVLPSDRCNSGPRRTSPTGSLGAGVILIGDNAQTCSSQPAARSKHFFSSDIRFEPIPTTHCGLSRY